MKNFLIVSLFLVFAVGCSKNELVIRNWAEGQITLNFRGEIFEVPRNTERTISDIPNGSYTYSATMTLPAGASELTTEGDVSGNLDFAYSSSRYYILYSSTRNDSTYVVYATVSRNLSNSASPTAAE
jgi:hypothetical protein